MQPLNFSSFKKGPLVVLVQNNGELGLRYLALLSNGFYEGFNPHY